MGHGPVTEELWKTSVAPSFYKTHPVCSIYNPGFYQGQLFTENKKPCHSSFRVSEIVCYSGEETLKGILDT